MLLPESNIRNSFSVFDLNELDRLRNVILLILLALFTMCRSGMYSTSQVGARPWPKYVINIPSRCICWQRLRYFRPFWNGSTSAADSPRSS